MTCVTVENNDRSWGKNWTLKIKSKQIKSNPSKKNHGQENLLWFFFRLTAWSVKIRRCWLGGKSWLVTPPLLKMPNPYLLAGSLVLWGKNTGRGTRTFAFSPWSEIQQFYTHTVTHCKLTIKMLGGDRPAALWPRSPWRRQPPQNPPRGCWRLSPAPPPAATGGDNMKRAQRFRTNPREASLLLSSLGALRGPKKILCLMGTGSMNTETGWLDICVVGESKGVNLHWGGRKALPESTKSLVFVDLCGCLAPSLCLSPPPALYGTPSGSCIHRGHIWGGVK